MLYPLPFLFPTLHASPRSCYTPPDSTDVPRSHPKCSSACRVRLRRLVELRVNQTSERWVMQTRGWRNSRFRSFRLLSHRLQWPNGSLKDTIVGWVRLSWVMNLLSSIWLIHFLCLVPFHRFQNSNRRETQHYAVQPLRIDQTMLPALLNEKEANRFTR